MTSSSWPKVIESSDQHHDDEVEWVTTCPEADREDDFDMTLRRSSSSDTSSDVIRCNRLVLAASSPFLEKALSTFVSPDLVLHTRQEQDFPILGKLIKYLHGGPMEVADPKELSWMFKLAKDLEIEAAVDATAKLLNELPLEEILHLLLEDEDHINDDNGELETLFLDLAAKDMAGNIAGQLRNILRLSGDQFERILQNDRLNICSEIEVYELARLWSDRNKGSENVPNILSSVRYGLIPRKQFRRRVKLDPWLVARAHLNGKRFVIPRHISQAASIESVLQQVGQLQNRTRITPSRDYFVLATYDASRAPTVVIYDLSFLRIIRKFKLPSPKHYLDLRITSFIESPYIQGNIIVITACMFTGGGEIHEIDMSNGSVSRFSTKGLGDSAMSFYRLNVIRGKLALANTSRVRLFIFDQEKKCWKRLRHIPNSARQVHSFYDKWYVFGRYDYDLGQHRQEIECLNTATNSFETVGELLETRFQPICCAWKDGIVVAFGCWPIPAFETVEFYSPITQTCRRLAYFQGGRRFMDIGWDIRHFLCTHGESLLLGMQGSGRHSTSLFMYSEERNRWEQLRNILLPTFLEHMMAVKTTPEILEAHGDADRPKTLISLECKLAVAKLQIRAEKKKGRSQHRRLEMQTVFVITIGIVICVIWALAVC